jgi:hypothetical protein
MKDPLERTAQSMADFFSTLFRKIKAKSKKAGVVSWMIIFTIFIFVGASMVWLYSGEQIQLSSVCTNKDDDRIFLNGMEENVHPEVEEFKLYKLCHLNDTAKKIRTSIYKSSTISTDDKRVLDDMCTFIIDDKLSSIQYNSCGKYLCSDNMTDEYKFSDCGKISDEDVSIIIDKLNEMKTYIKNLNVVDEHNYTRKIEKTIILLQNIETG